MESNLCRWININSDCPLEFFYDGERYHWSLGTMPDEDDPSFSAAKYSSVDDRPEGFQTQSDVLMHYVQWSAERLSRYSCCSSGRGIW